MTGVVLPPGFYLYWHSVTWAKNESSPRNLCNCLPTCTNNTSTLCKHGFIECFNCSKSLLQPPQPVGYRCLRPWTSRVCPIGTNRPQSVPIDCRLGLTLACKLSRLFIFLETSFISNIIPYQYHGADTQKTQYGGFYWLRYSVNNTNH